MIIVEFNNDFIKSYGKRVKHNSKLKQAVIKRICLFKENRSNPILKDHQLIGNRRGFRSFSITGDIRIIYYLKSENLAIFVDIGSHNQVY